MSKEEKRRLATIGSSSLPRYLFIFIFLIFIFLAVPTVSAQREFIIQEEVQGITIEYPKIFFLKQGKNYTFRANPINNSDGSSLTNATTDCKLTIVNSFGEIVEEEKMDYIYDSGYFKSTTGSNIERTGEISYSYYCNATERAGFVSVQAYITPTGLSPSINDTFYFSFLAFVTILGIIMYIMQFKYSRYLSIFSALSFLAGGLIIYTYPYMIEGELLTTMVSLIYYGIGLSILGANVIYDWLPERSEI